MTGALDSLEERESEEPEPIKAYLRARSILAKRDVPFTQQPFAAAIEAFSKRNIVTPLAWDKLTDAAKQRSFTVAGLAVEELLGDAHAELDRQLRASPEHTYKDPETGKWVYKGPNLREFRKFAEERLESAGWTPANPSHVETIFRTNIASAYSTGRVAEMTQPAVLKLRPYWQVRTVKDDRQRKTHRAADGVVLPADHPFWRTAFPPWGFNCRCRVVSRSQKWVDAHGGVSAPPRDLPDPGFASGTQQLLVPEGVLKQLGKPEPAPAPVKPVVTKPPSISPQTPQPQWPAPSPMPKPKAPPKPKGPMSSSDIMHTQLSGPQGSNPGGFYRSADGKERYVKLYSDSAQAVGEHLANRLYADLGLGRVKSQLFEHQGKLAYASEVIEGATPIGELGLTPELARKALDGLVGDLVTANWDAAGLTLDNMLVTKAGKVVRIDNGGTFVMRAQGGKKPAYLVESLTEWDGFFDPKINPAYAHLARKAGVSGPADLLPEIRKQLTQLESVRDKAGGWAKYIAKAAPSASQADAFAMLRVLDARTVLIRKKLLETEQAIQAKKAAEAAAKKLATQKAKEAAAAKLKAEQLAAKAAKDAKLKQEAAAAAKAADRAAKVVPQRGKTLLLEELAERDIPRHVLWAPSRGAPQPKEAYSAWRGRVAKQLSASLTADEEAVVMTFTAEYSSNIRAALTMERAAYEELQGRMIAGPNPKWAPLKYSEAKQYGEQLNACIARNAKRAGRAEEEVETVYRGLSGLTKKQLDELLAGDIQTWRAPSSTSWDPNTAARFYAGEQTPEPNTYGVFLEIKTATKTSGLAVETISAVKSERELIYGAGVRFRVLSVARDKMRANGVLMTLEELP
jgi:SPP1 gp7 family putative phage head morphogenesis protein